MPLSLSPEEMNIILALATPVDHRLRGEFLQNVASELARLKPAEGEIGIGCVHRVARQVQRQYYTTPQRTEPEGRPRRMGHDDPPNRSRQGSS